MRFFRGRGPCGGRTSPIGCVRKPVLALGRALPAERPRQYIGSGVGNILGQPRQYIGSGEAICVRVAGDNRLPPARSRRASSSVLYSNVCRVNLAAVSAYAKNQAAALDGTQIGLESVPNGDAKVPNRTFKVPNRAFKDSNRTFKDSNRDFEVPNRTPDNNNNNTKNNNSGCCCGDEQEDCPSC